MSEGEFLTARFSRRPGFVAAHFELTLEADAGEIWAFLTASDRLPQWLAAGVIELREGGAARLEFQDSGLAIDSCVTACDPPRSLAYSWSGPGQPQRPVRWTLEPKDGATHVALDLEAPSGEDMARAAAGWAAHLEMLAAAAAGAPMKFPLPTFRAAREAFAAQLADQAPATSG
jgi:uncharacterized protein YndB with AHSA1/START domain